MFGRFWLHLVVVSSLACGGTSKTPDAGLDGAMLPDAIATDGDAPDTGPDDAGEDADAGAGCITAIAVGSYHACALKTDGTVWCWGGNGKGQVGDGTMTSPSLPVKVPILGNTVDEITAGDQHTCVRKSDHSVWCWGWNAYSQATADGNTANRVIPGQIMAIGMTAAQVEAGSEYVCVRKLDGTLWCWGDNGQGQLGNGTPANWVAPPVQVMALGNTVADVSAGGSHTCARRTNNSTLWCWGSNRDGELGDGTVAMGSACGGDCKPSPVQALVSSATEVSAGLGFTCTRQSDGSIRCWGANYAGQLGDGTVMRNPTPTKVTAIGNTAISIMAANGRTCAAKNDGTLWCWGQNNFGELGDGTTTERRTPVKTLTLTSATRASNGYTLTCGLNGGFAWCWGDNTLGQLGIGMTGGQDFCGDMTQNCELAPVPVKALCP